MPTDIDVRHAQKSDVRALSAALGRAFYDDPVMKCMLPDEQGRAKALPRHVAATWPGIISWPAAESEVASRGGVIGAATLWDPPGRRKSVAAAKSCG